MAALTVKTLPGGNEWLYEIKWDGYRALLIKDGDNVQLRSRNDKNLTAMYPGIAAAGRRQRINQIVLDGEIVALGEDGRPSFQALQHRSLHPKHQIVFYAFDVVHADGDDLTGERLEARAHHQLARSFLISFIEYDATSFGTSASRRSCTSL